MRYERKFYIDEANKEQLWPLIHLNPASFIKAYPDRVVNSIYFDDQEYSILQENLDGDSERKKLRIRWYGKQDEALVNARLEIKSKIGLTGTKKIFEFPDMPLSDMASITEKVNAMLHVDYIQPALIVQYHRKYFESFDRHIRITVDSKIRYKRIDANYQDALGVVMELKYDPVKEAEAAEIMQHFPFRMTKYSKYAQGMTTELI